MLMLALSNTACLAASSAWYDPMLPAEIDGWSGGPVRVCDRTNLFDYMDGAGELYLAYDYRDLAIRDYSKPDCPKITAEVYRMTTAEDAYGVFTYGRSLVGDDPDRDYAAGLLTYWKGRFFVRILAERETAESKAAVLALGKSIGSCISEVGKRPDILKLLPKQGLVARSDRFFHKQAVLNFHYYLSDGNILNLSEKTDALLADYKLEGHKTRLLIVRYPRPEDASKAFAGFSRIYFADKPVSSKSPRIEQIERGEYVGISRDGAMLRLVFDAASEAQCKKLLAH